MDNKKVEYRPYKQNDTLVNQASLVLAVISVVMILMLKDAEQKLIGYVCVVLFDLIQIIWIVVLKKRAKIKINFSENEILYIKKAGAESSVLWSEVPYGAYVTSQKGHRYLFLAPTSLSQAELKKQVIRMESNGDILLNGFFLIPFGRSQAPAVLQQIKNLVDSKVPNISNRLG